MIFQNQVYEAPKVKEQFHRKLEDYVSLRYTFNKLKINEIASKLAMCERQLSRKTKSFLDMTPTEYLRKYRLQRASILLKQGFSVNQVTFEVGFSSYSYFARCFKHEFGCTAKEYCSRQIH
jgi:AraC-like DNA-binding protein